MIHINLLPIRAAQKKDKLRGQLLVSLLALILTAGACGVVYSSPEQSGQRDERRRLPARSSGCSR